MRLIRKHQTGWVPQVIVHVKGQCLVLICKCYSSSGIDRFIVLKYGYINTLMGTMVPDPVEPRTGSLSSTIYR